VDCGLQAKETSNAKESRIEKHPVNVVIAQILKIDRKKADESILLSMRYPLCKHPALFIYRGSYPFPIS